MRLFAVEVRRAMARGVTRLLVAIAAVGIVVTGVWVFAATKDATAAKQERQEIIDRSQASGASFLASQVQTCVDGVHRQFPSRATAAPAAPGSVPPAGARGGFVPATPGSAPVASGSVGSSATGDEWAPVYDGTASAELVTRYCQQQASARYGAGSYTAPLRVFRITQLWVDEGQPPPVALAPGEVVEQHTADSFLVMISSLLFIGALIGGASLVGSEWQTGSLVLFLTWEPRRTRVLLAKVLAAAVLAGVVAFVLQALFGLALLPAAAVKGSIDGMTAHWFSHLLEAMLRIAAIAAMSAALGASLAMIGRRTALALGIVFLYLAIGESLLGVWQPSLRPWLLGPNLAIFLTGQSEVAVQFARPTTAAGLTMLAYTVVAALLAAVAFRRRDFASG
jgi:hypothetical protein